DSTHVLIMWRGYDTCGSPSSYAGYAERIIAWPLRYDLRDDHRIGPLWWRRAAVSGCRQMTTFPKGLRPSSTLQGEEDFA
ncbi:hypothetical protein, partial [Ferrimicrobium acidiphilum]